MQPGQSLVLKQKVSRGWDFGVTAAVAPVAVSRLTSPAAARNSPRGKSRFRVAASNGVLRVQDIAFTI
jgi:hypothetical protein